MAVCAIYFPHDSDKGSDSKREVNSFLFLYNFHSLTILLRSRTLSPFIMQTYCVTLQPKSTMTLSWPSNNNKSAFVQSPKV